MKNLLLMIIGAAILFGCAKKEESVTVYTHRHYEADKTIYKSFEEQTGIKVNVVTGSADELIKRLEDEGELSPADMMIAAEFFQLPNAYTITETTRKPSNTISAFNRLIVKIRYWRRWPDGSNTWNLTLTRVVDASRL